MRRYACTAAIWMRREGSIHVTSVVHHLVGACASGEMYYWGDSSVRAQIVHYRVFGWRRPGMGDSQGTLAILLALGCLQEILLSMDGERSSWSCSLKHLAVWLLRCLPYPLSELVTIPTTTLPSFLPSLSLSYFMLSHSYLNLKLARLLY